MPLRSAAILASAVLTIALIGAPAARAADSPAPSYVSVVLRAQVDRPAAQVWKKIGGFCDLGAFLKETCTYRSGSGDVGTERVLRDVIVEVLVGKTPSSYTYWQTEGNMAKAAYHGTISVEPDGAGKSTIVYTLMYNQAALATDADRAAEHSSLMTRFQQVVDTMKTAVEAQK